MDLFYSVFDDGGESWYKWLPDWLLRRLLVFPVQLIYFIWLMLIADWTHFTTLRKWCTFGPLVSSILLYTAFRLAINQLSNTYVNQVYFFDSYNNE